MHETAEELLHLLTRCVRLLTREQVEDLRMTHASERVVAAGLALRVRVRCSPRLQLHAPLIAWEPGMRCPNFSQCSYCARSRWYESARPTVAYVASARGGAVFGGRGGPLKNPLQATHDVHVAEVLMQLKRTDADLAADWIGEDAMDLYPQLRDGRRPDAMILHSNGAVRRAIEFCGHYTKQTIADFHRHCSNRGWAYDLW